MTRYFPVLKRRSTFQVALRNKYDSGEGMKERRLVYFLSLLVWVSVLGLGVFYTKQVVVSSFVKLRNPPIITQSRLRRNMSLMYPAVTLCYKNGDGIGFKENILQAFNLTGYWKNSAGDYDNKTWINFGWGHQSLSELWNRATYDAHIIHIYESIEREFLPIEREHASTTIVGFLNQNSSALAHEYGYYYEHGRCYTFRPLPGHLPPPGSQYGLKFVMNYKYFPIMNNRTGNHSGHGHEDDLKPWESGRFLERSYKHIGGWDIFVHDPSDNWSENEPLTDSQQQHFYVEKGYRAQIKLGQSQYCTLDSPEDPCGSGSQTQCKEKCRWKRIMTHLNVTCRLPFTWAWNYVGEAAVHQCDTFNQTMMMMASYRDWVRFTAECSAECIRNCDGTLFSGELLRTERLPASQSESAYIDIFYSSGLYMTMTEEIGYTQEMFIADLGGIYGFVLGISIITLLEFFDWVLIRVWKLWIERRICRRKKSVEKMNVEKISKENRPGTPPPSYSQHVEYRAYSREQLI